MAFQFGSLVDGLFSGAKSVNDLIESRNRMAINARFAEAASQYYERATQPDQAPKPTFTPNADAGSSTPPEATAEAAPPEARKAIASMAVNTDLPTEARAFLDTGAGPESGGVYNIRYTPSGGVTYTGDQHPRIYETIPNDPQGRKSSAAGRYQITAETWDDLVKKYGYTDFSPKNQDDAAWHLAQDTYKQKTGGDLLADLRAGNLSNVDTALRGRWPTMNMSPYGANLEKYFSERTPDYEFGGRNPRVGVPAIAPPTPGGAPTATTATGAGAGSTAPIPAGAPSALASDFTRDGKPLTQKQQEAARKAAGQPGLFPPNQKYNSRGEAISSDLQPVVKGAYFPRGAPPNSGGGIGSALDLGAGSDPWMVSDDDRAAMRPPPVLDGSASPAPADVYRSPIDVTGEYAWDRNRRSRQPLSPQFMYRRDIPF